MSQLREIKRRIKSVQNIKQVTHAMQVVAASRMRKAQNNAQRGKAYAAKIELIMANVALNILGPVENPFLKPRNFSEYPTIVAVVFSPQRGLAGSLPTNMIREVQLLNRDAESKGRTMELILIGQKLSQPLLRRGHSIVAEFSDLPEDPTPTDIQPVTTFITEYYQENKAGRVVVLFPLFVNAITQVPTLKSLLPLDPTKKQPAGAEHIGPISGGFVFEPSRTAILNTLVPLYIKTQLYQARLETVASEYSARMVAMKNATDNASDIQKHLQLDFNQSRQAQITQELAEITSGTLV